MTRTIAPAVIVSLLVLSACGATGDQSGPRDDVEPTEGTGPSGSSSSQSASPDAPTSEPTSASPDADACGSYEDPTTGKPLCDFVDAASYRYRLAAAENAGSLLPELQKIAPWLEVSDIDDVYGACEDLERGVPAESRTTNAVTRFSGGADEQVSTEQATELLAVADDLVCQG
jgi:hypothetical protein